MSDADPILQMPAAKQPQPATTVAGVVSPLAGRMLLLITLGIFALLIVALVMGDRALVEEIIGDLRPLVIAAGAAFLALLNPRRAA